MYYEIKKVEYEEELDRALRLIWDTFQEFVAPDYSKEGVNTFRLNYIENNDFKEHFRNGHQTMYGAYIECYLIGVLSIGSNNVISCVFVDKRYHRKGVATNLFNYILPKLKENNINKIKLNASPYAVPFYHALGFKNLGSQMDYQGIIYTPMELTLI